MDKVKAKAGEFLNKHGKHDTTVHENVSPAVTHETIKPHQHEHQTTAIDREVHQDHHHTSVQPIQDRNVLPEQHHVHDAGIESRDHRQHGNDENVRAQLNQTQGGFRDERTTADATTSREAAPVLTGEHTHHHVHENIQPVVHRETVEPHVVHSINRIHEKHDKPAQIHETSALPAMNMSEFQGRGGALGGREERVDSFPGEPRNITGNTSGIPGNETGAGHDGLGTHGSSTGVGATGRRRRSSSASSSDLEKPGRTTRSGQTGTGTTTGKPSLMDKLNPKVDSNNDGQAGFMK